MKLVIEVDLENDAFQDGRGNREIRRVLEQAVTGLKIKDVPEPGDSGRMRDVNGNRVGTWKIEP